MEDSITQRQVKKVGMLHLELITVNIGIFAQDQQPSPFVRP